MYYASFGVLSLILHIIINHEYLWNKDKTVFTATVNKYRNFMISVMVYYVSDIMWGFFYDSRIIPLAYADTVLYFFSMVLSVLLWTRFVISYLDQIGRFGRFLTYAGWTIFTTEIICLIINIFNPIIFEFSDTKEYLPGMARFITLAMQVVLFLLSSVYCIVIALRSEGKQRIRHKTIGFTGVVMSVFIVLQTVFPLLPFYAIGLLIGTVLIHIFVEEDVKLDHAIEMLKIQKRVEHEKQEVIKAKKNSITFGRIAESLASNYDLIYYVDTRDNSYVGYLMNENHGLMQVSQSGDDFFQAAREYLEKTIYHKDRDRVMSFMTRSYMLSEMKGRRQFSADYRLIVSGVPRYKRVIVRKTNSGEHFIVAYEDVDEEIRNKKEQPRELITEKKLARQDELTGVKNKTAYAELEQFVQGSMDNSKEFPPFALVVCDINDLKETNDTQGHQAGDELIRSASSLLCDTFVHSPVFRIGGDEFVVYLDGDDYAAREELISRIRVKVFENLVKKDGPVIALGVGTYEPGVDMRISDVFERADCMMYEDKRELKGQR